MEYVPPIGGDPNDPYIDANPALGVEGSPVPAAAIEHPMREIMNVILAAGIIPDSGDLTQLSAAIQAMILASLAPDASETVKGIIKIATTAEAQALIDDIRALTALKLAAVLDVTALGRNQTFQDVKAVRANNIIYTNTDSAPIMVFVSMTSTSTAQAIFITIDDFEVQGSNGTAAGNSCYATFIVPPGSEYKARMINFSAILHWGELRF